MDKTAIKNFAVRARNKLIEQVKQKAFEIGIEKDNIIEPQVEGADSVIMNDKHLDKDEIRQRNRLINEIEQKGYEQVMEEVAYTWFNRFVALRFMEVNGYLPTGVRVLSSETEGKVEPDIISEALNINLDIDPETVYQFQDDNDIDGLYKYLLIKQCNSLNDIMPFIFEKIADYTEILLPNNLLSEGSVIRDMDGSIAENDWCEVEIIGWMYQYYISEKKDEVIQAKKKYKKEEIPFATQLFTPDWIARYMVQNSLGRYWLESHPEDDDLKEDWEFYLEDPNPDPDIEEKLEPYIDKNMKVEEITVFDPCCGSGHILVYVFDVLYQIYKKSGYLDEDIPRLIIENNLYGLDIDDRAYQLACLSVVMKALQYNKRFLQNIKEKELQLNITVIKETNNITNEDITYLVKNNASEKNKQVYNFIKQFIDAKIYGSLIDIDHNDKKLFKYLNDKLKNLTLDSLFDKKVYNKLKSIIPGLIKQTKIMNRKYDLLITNPPYMGKKYMNKNLKKYVSDYYADVKDDLFSVFLKFSFNVVKNKGHMAMVTPYVWMFISSYKDLRNEIVKNKTISSLIQLEYNSFEPACVPVCTFTLRNYYSKVSGEYIKLSNFKGINKQPVKTIEAINNPKVNYRFSSFSDKYKKIPDSPIAFWTSDKIKNVFEIGIPLSRIADPKQGMATSNNNRFLRNWFEVNINNIGFKFHSRKESKESIFKWFPYNKGGKFRKWYGNNQYVVNWKDDGKEIKNTVMNKYSYLNSYHYVVKNEKYYFKKGITWSKITSSTFSARFTDYGFIFSDAGMKVIVDDNIIFYMCAFMNSKLVDKLLSAISETMNYEQGNIAKLPIIYPSKNFVKEKVEHITNKSIEISKTDWDSFETSWDFKKHPLLTHKNKGNNIEDSFNNWSEFSEKQFYKLKENEEELNRIYIDIYGLENELTPEVDEKDVTVRKADRARDIRSFMSYAVGCMLGRYSLDEEGLVYAGGEFDESKYETFKVDKDGIIPILDDEYFDDDIVARFVEFVKVTFGKEHLEENLEYIADALVEGGTSSQDTARETIRRYFLFDFIKDHNQTYNKRPIYWLFQSDGRGKAFNALIYMHRYDSGTVARVRTDYLHELQKKIEAEKVRLQGIIDSDLSARERNKAKKRLKKLDKHTEELVKYDEVLNHVANQQIEIDLDDGVKKNYKKFADVLKRL